MLRITVVENPEGEKWILQGQLTGEFASELSTTWCSSMDRSTDRLRIVDLSEVTSIDRNGEEILRRMIHQGAQCVATGIYTKHLLEELQALTQRQKEDLSAAYALESISTKHVSPVITDNAHVFINLNHIFCSGA
jgi:hypothetical protein